MSLFRHLIAPILTRGLYGTTFHPVAIPEKLSSAWPVFSLP